MRCAAGSGWLPPGDAVSRQWGHGVVMKNGPGAGGVIASQALVSSPSDGYI
jgi:tripartite-type tricarboxylate transporter receptor subunit TctC